MGVECLIEAEAWLRLAGIFKEGGYKSVFLAADINTWNAFGIGGKVTRLLEENGVKHGKYVFGDECLVPDEAAVGRLITAIPGDIAQAGLIVGIGSGAICDLSRFCAYRLNADFIMIPTAASMDGYLSSISPLIINRSKTTFEGKQPVAALCDPELLRSAPGVMTSAGFGDIMGKVTSGIDWILSRELLGERYVEPAAEKAAEAVRICEENADGAGANSADGVKAVVRALLLSGEAINETGNSRPASGAEHHLSHYWEEAFLREGKPPVLHGIKVAVAALTVIRVNGLLLKEESCGGYDGETVKSVISRHTPDYGRFEGLLKRGGCPVSPAEIGIGRQTYIDGILNAFRLRERFTVLRLAHELGALPRYAGILADFYY